MCHRKCFWNLCFKVDSGQNQWIKSRHRHGNCEVHIFTAQYYQRCWGFAWLHQKIVAALMPMTVRSQKKSTLHNSVTAFGKQTWNLICEFFNIPAGSVLCQEEATGDVHKPIQILCNSTYWWFSVSGKVSSIPVSKVPVVVAFNSMIPQYQSLKNSGTWCLCHRSLEIGSCNNYCLPTLCPHQFNTACKMYIRHL